MPLTYQNYGPGPGGPTPALDGLRKLGILDGADSGSRGPLNPNRLTESPDHSYQPPTPMVEPMGTIMAPIAGTPADGGYGRPPVSAPQYWPPQPPSATPPSEVSGQQQAINSLKMAYGIPPAYDQQTVRGVKRIPDTPKLEQ